MADRIDYRFNLPGLLRVSRETEALDKTVSAMPGLVGKRKSVFEAGYSTLRSRVGTSFVRDRVDVMRIGDLLDLPELINMQADEVSSLSKNASNTIFDFVVRKAWDPSTREQGFGNFVLKEGALGRLMEAAGPEEADQIEAVTAAMKYLNSSIQFDTPITSKGKKVPVNVSLSRNVVSEDYLRQQASVAVRLKSGDITDDMIKNALTFDIETAGLGEDAGIWQIAYKQGDGTAQEIFLENARMDMGMYEITDPKTGKVRSVKFKDYLAHIRGTGEAPKFGTQFKGLKTIIEKIADEKTNMIVGQNVKFDLEQVLMHAEQFQGFDPEFDQSLDIARRKMLGDGATVFDTKAVMQLFRNPRTDVVNLPGSGKVTSYSQENMVAATSLLEDAKARGFLSQSDIDKLRRLGLHDAQVDTGVTAAFARLLGVGLREGQDVLRNLDELDPEILAMARASGAITPVTKLGGKETPFLNLVRSTRFFGERATDLDVDELIYMADPYRNVQLDMNVHSLNASDDIQGFINPEYIKAIHVGEGRYQTPSKFLGIADRVGKSTQSRLEDVGVAFAGLDEPSRIAGALLNRVSSTLELTDQQRAVSETVGHLTGGVFYNRHTGMTFDDTVRNVMVDPRILALIDDVDENILGGHKVGGKRVGRLSALKYEDNARVNIILDIFRDSQNNLDVNKVDSFVSTIEQLKGDILHEDGAKWDTVDRLRRSGLLDEGEATSEELVEMFKQIDTDALRAHLTDSAQYGVQIATFFDPEGGGDIRSLASLIQEFSPGRDLTGPGFDIVVPELAGKARARLASLPIFGLRQEVELVGEVGSEQRERAARVGKAVSLETDRAVDTVQKVQEYAADDPQRLRTAKAMSNAFGDRALPMTRFVKRNVGNIQKSAAGVAAFTVFSALHSREREQAKYESTIQDVGQYGYETEEDYSQYKAEMGESVSRDYSQNPVSRQDPLQTAGLNLGLHDNRTGHHRMGPQKDAHLFGGVI